MGRAARVLIVDDDASLRQTIELIVRAAGMAPVSAMTGGEAIAVLSRQPIDVVLLDVQLPDMDGLQVLSRIRESYPDVGVLVVSVVKEIPVAVEAIKLGALDYVTKDFSPSELSVRLTRSLEQLRRARELAWLREEVAARDDRPMVGRSPVMAKVIALAEEIARKPVSVLLTGESGTRKEMLARHLHAHSDRAGGPFVAVNLAALPPERVERTLFGQEKGASSGAARQSFGKFELANGGTLFLDEITELRLDLQAKLLRALQEHAIERVGGTRPIPLDVRFICATRRSLPELVENEWFREDLYRALNAAPIELPPLRARKEDVRELAQHFLARFAADYGRSPQTLTQEAIELLERHAWPGNVRELENLMERIAVVNHAVIVDADDLPLELSVEAELATLPQNESAFAAAVAAFEKSLLKKVLHQNGWNRRRAAERLGIGYSTLKAKLRSYGLSPAPTDDEDS